MTYKRREEIFSKEVITYSELAELLEVHPSTASIKINEIKMKFDRLHMQGKIHILDYLDWLGVKEQDMVRYSQQQDNEKYLKAMKNSVCV